MRRCLAAVVVLAACNGTCVGWNTAFERMVEQPKYKSYAPSEFYPDGRSMRAPPDGTVSVEEAIGPVNLTEGGPPDAPVTEFPVPLSRELLARGQDRFDIYCAPCHGIAGDGDSVVATKMQLRHPPSLGEERLRTLVVGSIYRVIQHGYGLMPSYEQQLTVTDRWAVVAYVRALQASLGTPLAMLPPAMRTEAAHALQ